MRIEDLPAANAVHYELGVVRAMLRNIGGLEYTYELREKDANSEERWGSTTTRFPLPKPLLRPLLEAHEQALVLRLRNMGVSA